MIKRAKWNLAFVACFGTFNCSKSQGVVVDLVLRVRELAQVSVLAILNACQGDIRVTTTGYRQVSKLTFLIKERTSDFVIGMRKPTLINTPAGLVAYCGARFGCEHVLIKLN